MIHINAPFSGWATLTQNQYGTDSHNSPDYWVAAFDFDLDANPTGSSDTALQDRQALAVAEGVVVAAYDGSTASKGPGNFVTILFNPGTYEQFYASYWHLKGGSVSVSVGDEVRAGTVVGEQGDTGGSNGAHLHFQWSKEIYDHALGVVSNSTNSFDNMILSVDGDSTLGNYTPVQGTLGATSGPLSNNLRYIVGLSYKDGEALSGNSLDNWFQGGPGIDSYDGKSGFDTVDFTDRPSIAWTVDLNQSTGYATASTGGTEQLRSIEAVSLGRGNDLVYLSDEESFVRGGEGTDTVVFNTDLDNIWFWKDDDEFTGAFTETVFGYGESQILQNVERLRGNASTDEINLAGVENGRLGTGSSSASSKYILPDFVLSEAFVDGGGGYDVVSISGTSDDWAATAHTTAQTRLTKSGGPGAFDGSVGAPSDILDTVDLVNVEAVEFDDGTFTIEELLGDTSPSGKPRLGISVKPGVDPFDEGDSGSNRHYEFDIYLDSPLANDLYVHVQVRGYGANSAEASDFEDGIYKEHTYKLSAGATLRSINVDLEGDDIPEYDEQFRVEISVDSEDRDKVTIVNDTAYGTIVNDDGEVRGDDYGDTFETATSLTLNSRSTGWLENPSDVDVFSVYLLAGVEYGYGLFYDNPRPGLSKGSYKFFDSEYNEISFVDTDPIASDVSFTYTPTIDSTFYFQVKSSDNVDWGSYGVSQAADRSSAPLIAFSEVNSSLSEAHQSRVFQTYGYDPGTERISFRTDISLENVRLTVLGINGEVIAGNWVQGGTGVVNFDFRAAHGEYFLIKVEALSSGGYGDFTIQSHYQTTQLAPLQTVFTGGASNDSLTGNGLANELNGLAGHDILIGGRGDDTLSGGGGDDTLLGEDGNDTLRGGAGQDELNGGGGTDLADYFGAGSGVVVDLFNNVATGGDAAGDSYFLVENVQGTTFGDRLTGDNSANRLIGRQGNDSLDGGKNDDSLEGGDGFDSLIGGDGDDRVWGGNGRDTAILGDGNDIFYDNSQDGELGRDTVFAGNGNDTVFGNGGDDVLWGEAGNDKLFGGFDNDTLKGGDGYDTLDSGFGHDSVVGGNGRDLVYLKGGADIFDDNAQTGIHSHDTVFGGGGNDTINGGGGQDEFHGKLGEDSISGGIGNDRLFGGDGFDTILGGNHDDQVWGGNGQDLIYLGYGSDVFYDNNQSGDFGRDRVFAGKGNDTIYVGGGNDTMTGGLGADNFVFNGGFDANTITDFEKSVDTLTLSQTLWGGGVLTEAQVISDFASVTGGVVVFDFFGGNTITLINQNSLAGLDADIAFI